MLLPFTRHFVFAMPVSTRSARVFDSDVVLPLMRATKVRSARRGFVLNKEQLTYALSRPSKLETETHVFVPVTQVPKTVLSDKRLPIRVVALSAGAAFDRGTFHIARVSSKYCVLEKVWTCKQATPIAKEEVAMQPVDVAASAQPVEEDEPCFFKEPAKVYKRAESAPTAVLPPVVTQTQIYARPVGVPTAPAPVPNTFPPISFPRAIRTVFSGIEYRSRLESRFAMLLSALNIRFVYEPMKYNNNKARSTYTIDFFLPAQQLYVELKPKRPHIEEEMKCEEMSKSGFRVSLMYGSSMFKLPFRSEYYKGRSHRDYAHHDALRGMTWIDGVKLAGDTVFVHGTCGSTLDAPGIHLNQVMSAGTDARWSHESITSVFKELQRTHPRSPPS